MNTTSGFTHNSRMPPSIRRNQAGWTVPFLPRANFPRSRADHEGRDGWERAERRVKDRTSCRLQVPSSSYNPKSQRAR